MSSLPAGLLLREAVTEPASLRTLFDEERAAGSSSQEKRGGNESRDAAARGGEPVR